jgi:ATP/maltotriose-dependent transcriptional regulator MalT
LFEAALLEEETAEALIGLAEVHRWVGEVPVGIELRERAYALSRRRGDAFNAAFQAIELCIEYDAALGNYPVARGWLERAERLTDDPSVQPLQGWMWLCRWDHAATPEACREFVQRAIDFAREQRDLDLELCALSTLGVLLTREGDIEGGLRCVDEAMAGALGGDRTEIGTVVYTGCMMMTVCDLASDLQRARLWCRAADKFVRQYGVPFLYAKCHAMYGRVLATSGRWTEAERELAKVVARTRDVYPAVHGLAAAGLAELWVWQGRLDDAESLLAQVDNPYVKARPEAAMHLRRGEPALSVAVLERWLGSTYAGPVEAPPVLALLVEAHVADGDLEAAAAAVSRLERAARADEALTSAHTASARGRLYAARGEAGRAAACLEEAIDRFVSLEFPYETARARIELARAVAETRREVAIAEARAALAIFDRLGAADADAAAALLRSLGAGGRTGPRDAGVLSRREQEVLALLASGLSNQEIAERLFISPRTAGHHVSNLLSKLGAKNRAEAAAIAARSMSGALAAEGD